MEENENLASVQTGMEGAGVRQLGDEECAAFVQAYPGLDPQSIPKSVWASVRGGRSLTEAYGSHERAQLREDNRRLKEEMERMTRAAEDREKSLGSVRTSGRAKTMDPFLMGFNEE